MVFSPARGGCAVAAGAQDLPRVGERAVRIAHAGDDLAGRGIDDVADGIDRDDGARRRGRSAARSRRCRCPAFVDAVRRRRTFRPSRPRPRRSILRAPARSSPRPPPCSRSRPSGALFGLPPTPRSNRIAAGTIGTLRTRPRASRCCVPRASGPSPVAASRPNALPPARTIALTLSTMLSGSRRSVSRVPGAPPRCDTPPTRVAVDEHDRAAGRPFGEREVADLDAGHRGERRGCARGRCPRPAVARARRPRAAPASRQGCAARTATIAASDRTPHCGIVGRNPMHVIDRIARGSRSRRGRDRRSSRRTWSGFPTVNPPGDVYEACARFLGDHLARRQFDGRVHRRRRPSRALRPLSRA